MFENIKKSIISKKEDNFTFIELEHDKVIQKKSIRDCIYGRINISVKNMDYIICSLIIAMILAVICGVIF
ncbi:hypothetical protein [uncultured Robinsoniella sp.]|uniref:hypothetical protein n=1 Tax=uncultured Robinsoniella sp. TaxID=904190 RepID=UPI00374F2268